MAVNMLNKKVKLSYLNFEDLPTNVSLISSEESSNINLFPNPAIEQL
jgi:hypothetical protein